jgi:hypothetical protein
MEENRGVMCALEQARPKVHVSPLRTNVKHTFLPLDKLGPFQMCTGALIIPMVVVLGPLPPRPVVVAGGFCSSKSGGISTSLLLLLFVLLLLLLERKEMNNFPNCLLRRLHSNEEATQHGWPCKNGRADIGMSSLLITLCESFPI